MAMVTVKQKRLWCCRLRVAGGVGDGVVVIVGGVLGDECWCWSCVGVDAVGVGGGGTVVVVVPVVVVAVCYRDVG